MHVHESPGRRLIEGVPLVVGGEVEVVERFCAAAPVHRDVPAVQHQPDLTGDVLLRLGHK